MESLWFLSWKGSLEVKTTLLKALSSQLMNSLEDGDTKNSVDNHEEKITGQKIDIFFQLYHWV